MSEDGPYIHTLREGQVLTDNDFAMLEKLSDGITKMKAEIERLRAEWNRQFTRNAELIVEHDALRAEIERLRNNLSAAVLRDQEAEIERLKAELAQLHESNLWDCPSCGNRLRLALEAK